ncbi:MAG: HD domain-containing phosphohydrolase [Thermodesulfobacteriota bacterium]
MTKERDPEPDAAGLRRRAEERLREKQKKQISDNAAQRAVDMQALVQELQIHQIELEIQNEELRKSRVEAEELLVKYTDLYDFAPVGYLSLDRAGAIRRINHNGARLLGEDRYHLRGRHFATFVFDADRSVFSDFLKQVFTAGAPPSPQKGVCEVKLGNKEDRPPAAETQKQDGIGGAARHVRIEATPTEDGRECRAAMIDITRGKQAEAALLESHARLERNLKGAVDIISETIERKGPYASGHHRRIAALTSAIAREAGLTHHQVQGIELAAAVFDIGLMTVPVELLQDEERLDGIRLALYQGYPQAGHDALKKIESPWPIAEIILQHRECYDGSGFPRGLKGEAILVEARILAVACALEDLTSHRSYRNAFTLDQALASISSQGGTKYDRRIVAACLSLFKTKGFTLA